jgi:hypothetical protein
LGRSLLARFQRENFQSKANECGRTVRSKGRSKKYVIAVEIAMDAASEAPMNHGFHTSSLCATFIDDGGR